MNTFALTLVHAGFALVVTITTARSASAAEGWVQTFPDARNATALAATADGGLFAVGNALTFDDGVFDVWVARLDADGDPIWQRKLEAPGWEQAADVVVTPGGGCLVAGFTRSFGAGGLDGWLVAFDASGAVLWQRTYGGPDDDEFVALTASPGGYYVGGVTGPGDPDVDAWVLEVDTDGGVVWQRRLGGAFDDRLRALCATADGPVFTADSRSALSGEDGTAVPFFRPWVVALDPTGAVRWQKTYNYSGGDGWNDILAVEGGFVVVGEIIAAGFFRGDLWAVKLDADGDVAWDRRYGDNLGTNFVDNARAVRPAADGGFHVLGSTGTAGAGSEDWWLLELDASGLLESDTTLGQASFDGASALELSADGDLLAAGFFGQEAVVMRLEPDGTTACDLTSPSGPNAWTDVLEVTPVAEPAVAFASSARASGAIVATHTGAIFLCPPIPGSFCDASDGALDACPCGNPGLADTGCDNAQGTGGVRAGLSAQDTGAQTATLTGTGFPPATTPTAIVIRGNDRELAGVTFFDGVRCVGLAGFARLAATTAAGGASTHTFGHGVGGGTFYYQIWYRNTPITFCDSTAAANVSSGRAIAW